MRGQHVHDQADHCFFLVGSRFSNQQGQCCQAYIVYDWLVMSHKCIVTVQEVDEQAGGAALVTI